MTIRAYVADDVNLDDLKRAARTVYSGGVGLSRVGVDENPLAIFTAKTTFDEMVAQFQFTHDLVPWVGEDAQTLYLDIETHNAGKEWDMPIREFFRMGQWAWGVNGKTHVTTDYDEFMEQVNSAKNLVAHNGHQFDFSVLLGDRALEMGLEGRLFDPMVYANLAFPAPEVFTARDGSVHYLYMGGTAKVVPHSMKWLGLDNLCYQLGTGGKLGSLKELAKKYNPPKTLVADLDYGLIPVDDPEFVQYAEQDVVALQGVTRALMSLRAMNSYDWREQAVASVNAQITRTGFCVDVDLAEKVIHQQESRKERTLKWLQEQYEFPTEGKAPWSSKPGKIAIMQALTDHGVDLSQRTGWPHGKTGPSLSGKVLLERLVDTPAEELATNLAMLMGQRPLAQQALTYVRSDGRVHPDINAFQRSGRLSVTKPSLATWSAHGPKAQEKEYFVPDKGCVLLEFDMSNADSRAVAAMSGDKVYHDTHFSPGVDGHSVTAEKVFGAERFKREPELRQTAKIAGHGYNYGAGAKKLSYMLRVPLEDMEAFVSYMKRTYTNLHKWQNMVRRKAEAGYVVNRWGRRMVVEPDKAYSQSPALMGQSSTRELLFDGLFNLPVDIIRMIKVTVHDAIILAVPKERVDEVSRIVVESFTTEWNGVAFPLKLHGLPSPNWWQAGEEPK